MTPPDEGVRAPGGSDDLDSTRTLLELTRGGDLAARERLFARYHPALQAWAHGRVPQKLRGLADSSDLVQMTFMKAFERIDQIEYLHEGGFFAYLRTVLRSRIVDLLREAGARPVGDSIPSDLQAPGPSPFELAVGSEVMDSYEAALEQLTPQQRAAVTLRIEFGLTFREVADAIGSPSANAARMVVHRAVLRLSEVMDECAEQ